VAGPRAAARAVAVRAQDNEDASTSKAPGSDEELFGGFGYTRLDAILLGAGASPTASFVFWAPSPARGSPPRASAPRVASRAPGTSPGRVRGDRPGAGPPQRRHASKRRPPPRPPAGLIGLGYALYYGLQAIGMDAGMAGNWVQLIIFLGICIGWISTYLYR